VSRSTCSHSAARGSCCSCSTAKVQLAAGADVRQLDRRQSDPVARAGRGRALPIAIARTRWGCGCGSRRSADALISVGVSPFRARLAAALVGGALAGAGGAQLTLAVGGFVADMSGGRGYIAIAMVILAAGGRTSRRSRASGGARRGSQHPAPGRGGRDPARARAARAVSHDPRGADARRWQARPSAWRARQALTIRGQRDPRRWMAAAAIAKPRPAITITPTPRPITPATVRTGTPPAPAGAGANRLQGLRRHDHQAFDGRFASGRGAAAFSSSALRWSWSSSSARSAAARCSNSARSRTRSALSSRRRLFSRSSASVRRAKPRDRRGTTRDDLTSARRSDPEQPEAGRERCLHGGDESEPRAARRDIVDEDAQRRVAIAGGVPARELARELEQVVGDDVRFAVVAGADTISGARAASSRAPFGVVAELGEVDAVDRADLLAGFACDRGAAGVAVLDVRPESPSSETAFSRSKSMSLSRWVARFANTTAPMPICGAT